MAWHAGMHYCLRLTNGQLQLATCDECNPIRHSPHHPNNYFFSRFSFSIVLAGAFAFIMIKNFTATFVSFHPILVLRRNVCVWVCTVQCALLIRDNSCVMSSMSPPIRSRIENYSDNRRWTSGVNRMRRSRKGFRKKKSEMWRKDESSSFRHISHLAF